MGKLLNKLAKKGKTAAKRAYKNVETRVLVAEGRRSVEAKVRTAKKVTRKAVRTGIITGALAATAVLAREIRKRKKLG